MNSFKLVATTLKNKLYIGKTYTEPITNTVALEVCKMLGDALKQINL